MTESGILPLCFEGLIEKQQTRRVPALDTQTKKIVIVEPSHSGHHFYYVRLLAERALSENPKSSVLLLTSEIALNSKEYQIHLSAMNGLEVQTLSESDFSLKALSKLPSVSRAETISFPDADRLLPQLALGFWTPDVKTTFLVMRADGEPKKIKGHGAAVGLAKKVLILISNVRKNVIVYSLKSSLSKRHLPIPWVSDPITVSYDKLMAKHMRTKLDQMSSTYWLGVFGYMTPRKNLPLIVEVVLRSSDLGLVVAGTIDPDVLREIKPKLDWLRDAGRLFELSGTLSDTELDSAIATVDCVVAAHSNDGPSGIVAKGAILRKPLVLAGAKTLKRDAKYLGDQAKWSKLDSDSIFKNIGSLREAKVSEFPAVSIDDEFASKLIP